MKTCALCQQTQPKSQFHQNRTTKDGLSAYCKPCRSAIRKTQRKNRAPQCPDAPDPDYKCDYAEQYRPGNYKCRITHLKNKSKKAKEIGCRASDKQECARIMSQQHIIENLKSWPHELELNT